MITGDFRQIRTGALRRLGRELSQSGKLGRGKSLALFQNGLRKLLVLLLSMRDDGPLGLLGFARMGVEKAVLAPQGFFQRRPENAYAHPDGLVDLGGSMNAARLIGAYAQGVYPWNHASPLKWWSPSKRAVLFFGDLRIEKNLRRLLRQKRYSVTFDVDFESVMRGCARPRPGRLPITWIDEETVRAYRRLFALGHAHSVEVWDRDGTLVGGLYGVVQGGVFVIESQFADMRDASKVGFVTLMRHLKDWGFVAADGKVMTGHLKNFGMTEISRSAYLGLLHASREHQVPQIWLADPALDPAEWKPEDDYLTV